MREACDSGLMPGAQVMECPYLVLCESRRNQERAMEEVRRLARSRRDDFGEFAESRLAILKIFLSEMVWG